MLPDRALTVAAFVATLAVTAIVVAAQPIGAPWWFYGDADGTYTASALNIAAGRHTNLLAHPGMPTQELLAATYGLQAAYHRVANGTNVRQFADAHLLNLDATRPVFRTWAILLFFVGAIASFFVGLRLFGHWVWASACGLLWLAAPDHQADSIQSRPDVLLCIFCLLVAFLLTRAWQRRDALAFLAAAVVLGLALTEKIHAIGLLPPLVLAVAVGHPEGGWVGELKARLGAALRRSRVLFALLALVWIALAAISNRTRLPFIPSSDERNLLLEVVGVIGGYALLSWLAPKLDRRLERLLDPFYALVAIGLALGVAIPVTFLLDDGLNMLVTMRDGLLGRGVNAGLQAFPVTWSQFTTSPLKQAAVVFAIAAIAAVVGAFRRNPLPAIWFSGALALAVLAAARLSTTRYYAPAYVLAVPAAVWLFRRLGPRIGGVLVALLVAYVLIPQFQYLPAALDQAAHDERVSAEYQRLAVRVLHRPREIILTSDYAPVGDVRYLGEVEHFVSYTPAYPYRFLADVELRDIAAKGLVPRYYAGPEAVGVTRPGTLRLGGAACWRVVPRPELATPDFGVIELHGQRPC